MQITITAPSHHSFHLASTSAKETVVEKGTHATKNMHATPNAIAANFQSMSEANTAIVLDSLHA